MKPSLLSLDPREMSELLEGRGRARAVFHCLSEGEDPFTSARLSSGARRRLVERLSPTRAELVHTVRAADDTTKLLLKLKDEQLIETVVIPNPDRTTLCVSSQVGCARACDFCLTATMGLKRNLECDEIIAQVVAGLAQAKQLGFSKVTNIVFMGMGEPLDNSVAVHKALQIISDDIGFAFGRRRITVSTVGTNERAVLASGKWPARLAWSLHAADDEKRRILIPTARASVMELRDWFMKALVNRPLFVECVLIDGLNDSEEDMRKCADLFRGAPREIRINLLPLNSIERPDLRPSSMAKVLAFRDGLRSEGYFCMVRRARGEEDRSACGQLAVLENSNF